MIGVATRNHYTETDWNRQNAWLVTDVSAELAGERAASYTIVVDRAKFLRSRFKVDAAIPVETSVERYVPAAIVAELAPQLQQGDFVNVISKKGDETWASHVGLVVLGPGGERRFLHSAAPAVIEETFDAFIARAAQRESRSAAKGKPGKMLLGFKFLRLREAPQVPPMAPQPRPRRRR